MFGGDREGLLGRSGNQSSTGQVIGFTKEAAGALLDSGDGCLVQGVGF